MEQEIKNGNRVRYICKKRKRGKKENDREGKGRKKGGGNEGQMKRDIFLIEF